MGSLDIFFEGIPWGISAHTHGEVSEKIAEFLKLSMQDFFKSFCGVISERIPEIILKRNRVRLCEKNP